jgi:hypothetical protein
MTHHGKDGKTLKKPRVVYTRADGATCGDAAYEPYINKSTGATSCRPSAASRAASTQKRKAAAAKRAKSPEHKAATKAAYKANLKAKRAATAKPKQTKEEYIADLANEAASQMKNGSASARTVLRQYVGRARRALIQNNARASVQAKYLPLSEDKERFDRLVVKLEATYAKTKSWSVAFNFAIKSGVSLSSGKKTATKKQ